MKTGFADLLNAPPNTSAAWDAFSLFVVGATPAQASGSSRAIVLLIPDAFLSRVISEHWQADPRNVEIIPQFLSHDPVIQGVATRLALEAQSGSPPERLYAESACEFLAHHMIHSYSTLSAPPPRASGGLPARRLKLI